MNKMCFTRTFQLKLYFHFSLIVLLFNHWILLNKCNEYIVLFEPSSLFVSLLFIFLFRQINSCVFTHLNWCCYFTTVDISFYKSIIKKHEAINYFSLFCFLSERYKVISVVWMIIFQLDPKVCKKKYAHIQWNWNSNAVNSLSVFDRPRSSNLHFSFAPDLDRATFLHSYVTIRARNLSGCALCIKMFMLQLKNKINKNKNKHHFN